MPIGELGALSLCVPLWNVAWTENARPVECVNSDALKSWNYSVFDLPWVVFFFFFFSTAVKG